MDELPRSEQRVIVVRAVANGEPAMLLLKDRDGWTLPRVELKERRSADVADLNEAVGARLGVEVSVLRCLSDEPGEDGRPRRQLYALEAHGTPGWTPPDGRWVGRTELETAVPPGSEQRRSVEAWLIDGPKRGWPTEDRDWVQPGWRDRVLAWVAEQLCRLGRPPVLRVDQIRLWEFSHVLRLETGDGGPFYLKARPSWGAAEPRLTRRLAERHPALAPAVVAVEPDRRWLLMRETRGRDLMEVGDPSHWESAAAAIARLQIDWLERTDELVALGCPRRTLAGLAAEIAPLLDDVAALQPHVAEGLTDAEVATLRHRRPELEALCRDLAADAIPGSLEHGDLWGDNVIVGEETPVFIDWEDASVAHPFFTPSLLLLSLDYTRALAHVPDARRRLRDAYLGPWTERGPLARWPLPRLERAFEVAQQIAMLHYAVAFWRFDLPRIETSWEVRAFPPLFMRRLVAS